MHSKSRFEPRSPRYGLFLVWGCRRPMCTNSGDFGGLLGLFRGTYCGIRGPFSTGKSSCCMCRVAQAYALAVAKTGLDTSAHSCICTGAYLGQTMKCTTMFPFKTVNRKEKPGLRL